MNLCTPITGITWNGQGFLYLQFKFVDADTIFIDSGRLLKNTKHINPTYVKHAAKIHTIIPVGQSHGKGNVYSQSSYLPSQEQQKPVGSSQTSKTIKSDFL